VPVERRAGFLPRRDLERNSTPEMAPPFDATRRWSDQ